MGHGSSPSAGSDSSSTPTLASKLLRSPVSMASLAGALRAATVAAGGLDQAPVPQSMPSGLINGDSMSSAAMLLNEPVYTSRGSRVVQGFFERRAFVCTSTPRPELPAGTRPSEGLHCARMDLPSRRALLACGCGLCGPWAADCSYVQWCVVPHSCLVCSSYIYCWGPHCLGPPGCLGACRLGCSYAGTPRPAVATSTTTLGQLPLSAVRPTTSHGLLPTALACAYRHAT